MLLYHRKELKYNTIEKLCENFNNCAEECRPNSVVRSGQRYVYISTKELLLSFSK